MLWRRNLKGAILLHFSRPEGKVSPQGEGVMCGVGLEVEDKVLESHTNHWEMKQVCRFQLKFDRKSALL